MELRYLEDFKVEKAIIHMVDKDHPSPVFSEALIDADEIYDDFISAHILKVLGDVENMKGSFSEVTYSDGRSADDVINAKNVINSMFDGDESDEDFIEKSKLIASLLHESVRGIEAIGGFDVAVASLSTPDSKLVAVLKLDYQRNYVHDISYDSDVIKIGIVSQEIALPGKSQKVSNCAVVKPNDDSGYQMLVLNKKVRDEEGNLIDYFLERFLGAEYVMDDTSKTVKFKGMVEKWLRKSVKDDIEKAVESRETVNDALSDGLSVDVSDVIYKITDSNDEKESLEDYLAVTGILPGDKFQIDKGYIEKKLKSKQIKTDTGFVLKGDRELFIDKNRFEIVHNGDGTVTYIIKNVRNIFER